MVGFGSKPNPFKKPSAGVGYGEGTSDINNPGSGTGYYTPGGGWVDVGEGRSYATPPPSRGGGGGGGSPGGNGGVSSGGISQAELEAQRQADIQRQAQLEAQRQAQAKATANRNLATSYATRQGRVSASDFAAQQSQRAIDKQSNRQAYQQYKSTESKYLVDVEKKAYAEYLKTGQSKAQARYNAQQWKKASESDIKASGGITTYSKQEEIPQTLPELNLNQVQITSPSRTSFKSNIAYYGAVTGTINYLGEKSKGLVSYQPVSFSDIQPYKLRGSIGPEQSIGSLLSPEETKQIRERKTSEAKETLSSVIKTAPYFTPAFPYLAVATGTESFITPGGKAEMKETELYLQSKGIFGSSVLSKVLPASMVVIGSAGIYGRVVRASALKEIKAFESTPTKTIVGRFEGSKSGMDIYRGVKDTRKSFYEVGGFQPFYKTEVGATFEGGAGYSIATKGEKVSGFQFVSGGRIKETTDVFNLVKQGKFSRVKTSLTDFQTGAGRIFTKNINTIKGKTRFGYDIILGKMKGKVNLYTSPIKKYGVDFPSSRIKVISNPAKKEYISFVGGGRLYQERNIIKAFGGTPTKVRRYTGTNKLSLIMPKPEVYAKIKVYTIPEVEVSSVKMFRGGGAKTPLSKTFGQSSMQESRIINKPIKSISPSTASYVNPLVEKQLRNLLPSVKTTVTSKVIKQVPKAYSMVSLAGSSRYTDQTQTKFNSLGVMQTKLQMPRFESKVRTNVYSGIRQVSEPRTIQRARLSSLVTPSTRSILKEETRLRQNLIQPQRQQQILKQTQRNRMFNLYNPRLRLNKIPKKEPPLILNFFGGSKLPKQSFGRFNVFGRRFGKFKLVGVGRTEQEAFGLGKKFASKTLGVTFKIPGVSGRRLSGYQTKYKKGEVLYIEPRGKRLKRVPYSQEIPEIQLYQRMKGGKR